MKQRRMKKIKNKKEIFSLLTNRFSFVSYAA